MEKIGLQAKSSATSLRESLFTIRQWPDFSVVIESYAGRAELEAPLAKELGAYEVEVLDSASVRRC